ncbi:MAG: EAL domain-containing protein, partial [Clostridia bacterium]|nr:EAL domain-containing protein [Clostridia bacterium]
LKESGHHTIAVSINISTIQMLEDGFANRLLNMIHEMRINPENVGIELTESVFATERAEINMVIDSLKAAGIKVLIDDFGTGYSSFAREKELNIDCLKIDKSFIDKLMVLKPEEAITGDIISMAHKQGHCVVAEGVEYEKQLGYLREHGCDRIQGFLISNPLDEDSALAFILKDKKAIKNENSNIDSIGTNI